MSDEIMLIFNFYGDEISIKCNIKEKLRNIIDAFCKMKKINLDYIDLMHDGFLVNKNDKKITIESIVSRLDLYERRVFILVFTIKQFYVLIVFSHLNEIHKEKKSRNCCIDEIFNEYLSKKKINRDKVILKYKNKQFNLSQTIDEFTEKNGIDLNSEEIVEIKFDVVDKIEVNTIKNNSNYINNNSQIYNSIHINTHANIPNNNIQYNTQTNNNLFYISQINELKRQLNEEKSKNQILVQQNTELNNIINNLKNNINNYEKRIKLLEKEIKNFNSDINSLNNSTNSIKYLRPGERILTVNFVSMGFQDIGHYSLACKNTDKFVKLEEKLNNDFKQLNNHDTYLEANGRRIKRFKTLDENNIKSNDIINIFVIDN